MSLKEKNKYMCFLCGDTSENGPGFCSISFHPYGELKKHENKEEYVGGYLLSAAHSRCLDKYFDKIDGQSDLCSVCDKQIDKDSNSSCSKLAVYEYKKKGCRGVLNMHDECIKNIQDSKFMFVKFIFGG